MGEFTGLQEKFADLQVNGGDLKEGTSTSQLQRILQCPVCKAVPLPPIFNCAKGHIICGKCRQQLKECGLCQAAFTKSRNFVMEDIVLSSKIACEFRELGCAMILSGGEFRNHVEKCEFRPLRCYQGSFDGCKRSIVDFQNYTKHLATVHNMKEQHHNDGGFRMRYSVGCDPKMKDFNNWNWTDGFLYFEGKSFIPYTFLRGDIFHLTLCLIGSDMDAANYKVRMLFLRDGDAEFAPFEATVPVIPIKSYNKISKECLHVILTKPVVESFCKIEEMPENDQQKKWILTVDYKILSSADKFFYFCHGQR